MKSPAVVSVPAVNFLGFEDSMADRNILVRINPAFFDPAVSGEKPQCFIVYWKYNASVPMAADIDRQFTDKFDFKKLQDLQGK